MSSWVVTVKRNRLQYLLRVTAVAYLVIGVAFALWPHWTLSTFGVRSVPELLAIVRTGELFKTSA